MKLDEIDLSKLDKSQKLALLDLLQEKKRRDRKKRPPFNPFSAQLAIIRSKALEKYLFAGNGFSKTALLVNWLHWAATGYNPVTDEHTPVPSVIYLVVDDPSKIEQKIIPEYRKWYELSADNIHKDGKPHPARLTYDNGSVCHVLTHEVNLLKLEGVEMTHLAFDEPPPRHVFQGLYRGGRVEGRPLQVIMAGTPLYQPWIRTDIYEKWLEGELPHVECFFGESKDNPYLPEDYEKRFGAILTEEEKATRFKGVFFDLSGQALAGVWSPKQHEYDPATFQWDEENPCVVAIDPHKAKPHHAVLLGCDRDNYLYVLDEFKLKTPSRNFAEALVKRGWFKNFTVIDIVYDCYGNEEQTGGEGMKSFGQVFNEELTRSGVGRARATTYADKNDEQFIDSIENVLVIPEEPNSAGEVRPKLKVSRLCKGLIHDIKQVQWMRDKRLNENKNKLDIQNTDYLACLKYALASNLYYQKPKDRLYVHSRPIYGFKPPSQRRKLA